MKQVADLLIVGDTPAFGRTVKALLEAEPSEMQRWRFATRPLTDFVESLDQRRFVKPTCLFSISGASTLPAES